jgi:hypothetical protein
MPRRVLVALVAVLLPLLAGPAAGSAAVAAATASVAAITAAPPTDPPAVTDNDLIPERDLSDCVSAMPQPDCGSDAKGGWRQLLVFAAVLVGLAFVGWRITRTVRRNRRALESSDGR